MVSAGRKEVGQFVLAAALALPGCEVRREPYVGSMGGYSEGRFGFCYDHPRKVDVLLVVDDSPSMALEQRTLAVNFWAFIDVLEQENVRADYRIAVTTTDVGNPTCDPETPEGGAFVATSCRQRLEGFVAEASIEEEAADAREAGCLAVCDHDEIDLLPTTTAYDDEPRPRPWIQNDQIDTNVPAGVTTREALACLGPQGVGGCPFESPLEAAYQALRRSYDANDPAYGFIRKDAILFIIIITDEADGSVRAEHEDIFMPEGSRVFWSDPSLAEPTSAIAWNAGVECSGGPGTYDECHARDHGADGNPSSAEDAVLHPLSRYIDFIQGIETDKQSRDPDQGVVVSVVGGVPLGYEDGRDILYADAADPQEQLAFGIGPGCESTAGSAHPPVRLREFADALAVGGERNLFSVCADDYTPALFPIAQTIPYMIRPACFPHCVLDKDPGTPGLDPGCAVEQILPAEYDYELSSVPACVVTPEMDRWDFPRPSDNVCYRMLTYNDTPTNLDDISAECFDEGWNVELIIERRQGSPLAMGTCIEVTCQLSQHPEIDCPLL